MLEALHVVPQPGAQVSYAHLLLLQRGEVLLGGGRPDPVVVAAARMLRLAPERGGKWDIKNLFMEQPGPLKPAQVSSVVHLVPGGSYLGVLGYVRATGLSSGVLTGPR